MTSRQAGRRLMTERARRRNVRGGARRRREESLTAKDLRRLLQLVACGSIFVALVAAKLLFPDAVGRLAESARQLIGLDADFKEAFAAVGRAVSGEGPVGDSLQDAYSAVFNPADPTEPEAVPVEPEQQPSPQPEPEDEANAPSSTDTGAQLLRHSTLPLPEADKELMREVVISPEAASPASLPAGDAPDGSPEDEDKEEPAETTATVSQVYTMAPMPENASLEQRNLGFDHCTPVAGRLSSSFGWREHPIAGGSRFHYGVSSSLGNYIMRSHEGGYITLYANCSKVTAEGGSVAKGDKIAEVGATGLATGPHLHFELHDGELYLNPIYYVAVG